MDSIAVLGATGSIGKSALKVIALHPERFKISALSGYSRIELLSELVMRYKPDTAVVAPNSAEQLKNLLKTTPSSPAVLEGEQGLCEIVSRQQTDTVIAGISGAAGLASTMAAIKAGKKVLIANKEPLVMLGEAVGDAAQRSGAQILPVDSEHNAIFQCLPRRAQQLCVSGNLSGSRVLNNQFGIRRITLTASGGPFLNTPLSELSNVSPDQAAAHPKWSMGRKISIDSATLMNKGLEIIEACVLFGIDPVDIDVVIHPQSVVHCLVEYKDGSILAQMGNPDMRTPITAALGFPDRLISGTRRLDICDIGQLTFLQPDGDRYPCLSLARRAAEAGGTAPAALNAANEEAVTAFCEGRIRFTGIYPLVDQTMQRVESQQSTSLESVLSVDRKTREVARSLLDCKVSVSSTRAVNL